MRHFQKHIATIWQVFQAAASIRDLALERRHYAFPASEPLTLYLDGDTASVRIQRWNTPQIDISVQLQPGIAWRIHTEQDEAGIYCVARSRAIAGSLPRASFEIRIPPHTHIVLRLRGGSMELLDIDGTVELPTTQYEQKHLSIPVTNEK